MSPHLLSSQHGRLERAPLVNALANGPGFAQRPLMGMRFWVTLLNVTALAAMSTATQAHAADTVAPGFALSRFEPSERGSRFFTLESLDWRSDGLPTFGVVADYAYQPLVIYQTDADGQRELTALARNFLVGHFGGTLNLGDRVRIGLDLPVVMYADGTSGQIGLVTYAAPQRSGLGDLRLSADVRFFGAATDPVRAGLGVRLYLPTGDMRAYASDGTLRGSLQVNTAGELARHFAWSARFGVELKGRELTYAGGQIGHELQAGLAGGFRTADGRLLIGPELAASTTFANAFAGKSTSVDVLLGARYAITPQWRIAAGIGRGVTVALGSPAVRALVGLEWSPAAAAVDPTCEALKADERSAALKLAAQTAETLKAEQAAKEQALRARLAEQHALESAAAARAAAVVELARAADDDGDGILNAADACPAEAGGHHDLTAKNGCPTGAVVGAELVLDPVRFQTASAVILPESDATLEAVLAAIRKLPPEYRYRVEGHTDDRGTAEGNKSLSRRRAMSVVAWLTGHGLAAARFEAQGFGAEQPLNPNDSDAARQRNRRVEFHIVNLEVQP